MLPGSSPLLNKSRGRGRFPGIPSYLTPRHVPGLKLPDLLAVKLMRLYGAISWQRDDGVSTDLYQITPLLRAGANRIIISSGPWSPALPGLFADGFVISREELQTFGTN